MIDKFAHERENVCVISRSGKYQLVVAECIFHSFSHIRTCKVMQFYFRAAFCTEFICQCIDGFLRIAIYGSISDHNSFGFCFVGRPCVVKSKVISQIFFQNRSVQRANRLNIQPCRFLQKVLYLSAVFSYDSDIITTSFACPVLFYIQSAEFTETVCGEQHFVTGIICHHNFRPVNHRRSNKCQGMLSEFQRISFFDHDLSICEIGSEKLFHHCKSFHTGYDLRFFVNIHEIRNICGMIRFHMLNNQIIRLAVSQ